MNLLSSSGILCYCRCSCCSSFPDLLPPWLPFSQSPTPLSKLSLLRSSTGAVSLLLYPYSFLFLFSHHTASRKLFALREALSLSTPRTWREEKHLPLRLCVPTLCLFLVTSQQSSSCVWQSLCYCVTVSTYGWLCSAGDSTHSSLQVSVCH